MQNDAPQRALTDLSIRQDDAMLIHAFIEENVEFIVVGGVATQYYGCRKWNEVDDLDLLLNPTSDNVKKLFSALDKLKINTPFSISDVTKPKMQIRIKHHPYYTELLTPSKEQDFTKIYESSIESNFHQRKARIISKNDLIKLKEDAINNSDGDVKKHKKDLECLKNA